MKQFFYEVTQFLFFLIAMTMIGVSFLVYATFVILLTLYITVKGLITGDTWKHD